MSRETVSISLALAALMLSAPSARAEIVNCKGVWTNRPCAEAPLGSIYEQPPGEAAASGSRASDDASYSERQTLVFNLERLRSRARSASGSDLDLSVTRQLCLSPSSTLGECKDAVIEKERQLQELMMAAALPAAGPYAGPSETNVTVIDNRASYDWRRHGRFHRGHGRPARNPHQIPRRSIDRVSDFPAPGNPNLYPAPSAPAPQPHAPNIAGHVRSHGR